MAQNGIQYTVKINKPQVEEYFWEFVVPPRKLFKEYGKEFSDEFGVKDIEFKTGLLKGVKHKGEFKLSSDGIEASLELPRDEETVRWSLKDSYFRFYSQDQNEHLTTLEVDAFKKDCTDTDTDDPTWILSCEFFEDEEEEDWTESVSRIRVFFLVQKITKDASITETSTMHKKSSAVCNTDWNNGSPEFFLSNELSDVKITCEGTEFPSHKVILCSRSPVFNRMLHSETEMTEAKEGNIQITDMKSSILKEMLRYMYCGQVENLEEISEELIIAADKYDLPYLKAVCESSLVGQINAENAVAMYSIGTAINAENLKKKSFDCIKINHSAIFKDSKEFLEFANQHPEVTFQLFKMQNLLTKT